jgi:hypothetical protein
MKKFSPHQMHGVEMFKGLHMPSARNSHQRGSGGCFATEELASQANAISVKQTPTLMTTQAAIATTMCAVAPSARAGR